MAEAGGVVVALFGMIVLSLFEIITRNAGLYAPLWVDPLRRQLVLWGGLLGAALASRAQAHIRFDFVQPRLKGRVAAGTRWLLSLAGAGVCVSLARSSWRFVETEQGGSADIGGIPAWIFATISPVAFGLMAFHFLATPVVMPTPSSSSGPSTGSRRP